MNIFLEILRWAPMVTWMFFLATAYMINRRSPTLFVRKYFPKAVAEIEKEANERILPMATKQIKIKLKDDIVEALCVGPMSEFEERLSHVLETPIRFPREEEQPAPPPPVSLEEIQIRETFQTELRHL